MPNNTNQTMTVPRCPHCGQSHTIEPKGKGPGRVTQLCTCPSTDKDYQVTYTNSAQR